jgi:hypothetical protein
MQVQPDSERIVQRAQTILESNLHFRGRAATFKFICRGDVLVVRGAVPTFYLKQVLQSILKDLDGVRMIHNEVQVMSATGDSSAVNE